MELLDPLSTKVIQETIQNRSEKLYLEVYKLLTEYHTERRDYNAQAKKSKGKSRSSHLGCRIKRNKRGPGITIEWYLDNFCENPAYGQKRRAFSVMPKKGKKSFYTEKDIFDWRTLDWEKELFRELEPKLTLLREYSLCLGRLSKAVSMFNLGVKKITEKENPQLDGA